MKNNWRNFIDFININITIIDSGLKKTQLCWPENENQIPKYSLLQAFVIKKNHILLQKFFVRFLNTWKLQVFLTEELLW